LGRPAVEKIGGVTVRRIGSLKYQGGSVTRYAVSFGSFILQVLLTLMRQHWKHGYAAVQVYSMPEALMFAALGPWLAGVPLIYDAGDLTTELYVTKFGRRGGPLATVVLRTQEWLGLRLAAL